MPTLQTFLLLKFDPNENMEAIKTIKVPRGASFLKMLVVFEGIIAYYNVPDNPPIIRNSDNPIDALESQTDRFILLTGRNKTIPAGAVFVDVLSTVVNQELKEGQTEPDQALITFPVFRLQY